MLSLNTECTAYCTWKDTSPPEVELTSLSSLRVEVEYELTDVNEIMNVTGYIFKPKAHRHGDQFICNYNTNNEFYDYSEWSDHSGLQANG